MRLQVPRGPSGRLWPGRSVHSLEETSDSGGGAMQNKAFATFLMLNDSYLPGALMLGYALRKQKTDADLVCMITEDITDEAKRSLELLFDHVIPVKTIFVPHKRRQERQDRPFWFTRLNALRLGRDGDLGFDYKKVVLLDADVLPIKDYASLFSLNTPAGIPNEDKSKFVDTEDKDRTKISKWSWHEAYDKICPHGHAIPKEITDRVLDDPKNMGLNGSLFVIKPSMSEFEAIMADIKCPEIEELISDRFTWPDMQYITMRWSGRWHSVDIKYSGFNGYPNLSVLKGTHYAGVKPWYFQRDAKTVKKFSRYEDFRYWFGEYRSMLKDYPRLQQMKRLSRLLKEIRK